jgi:hypothetical protein
VIKFVSDLAVWWFSPGMPVSSTNKTDHHDITEILLKVVLNTVTQTLASNLCFYIYFWCRLGRDRIELRLCCFYISVSKFDRKQYVGLKNGKQYII